MEPFREAELLMTRRQLFGRTALGLGTAALGRLLAIGGLGGLAALAEAQGQGLPGMPNFAPKAKRVIYLFMSGGPSQLDLWDYKPKLKELYNAELPDAVRRGQRITTMTSGQTRFPIAPTIYKFDRHDNGGDGAWVSELLSHTAGVVNELCVIKSMWTEAINHDPATTFIQTGSQLPGRPSMGAWLSYGLGSMNENLPTYVVLHSKVSSNKPNQAVYPRLWGTGFLPSEHQGIALRSQGDPVLFLKDPEGMDRATRRTMLDSLEALNSQSLDAFGDPEIAARIKQYELAYRLQASVPDLMDLSQESDETFELYGKEAHEPGTFAANCLLARRMVERGVRFIQIFHRGWDLHTELTTDIPSQAKDVDQGCAALIKDLKRRGLLEDTLVVWGGEFGRTVYSQGTLTPTNYGRDHHPRAFTMWMAGGGVKPGIVYGDTDDYGYNIVDKSGNPIDPSVDEFTPGAVHIHDLQATILNQLGIDHSKLTYHYQGRDFRLTDVHGHVVRDLLA
ncbi:MAG: DUF1501 domain-containing protein [Fimbriimonadaceae bacterium]|nr:DUF1501 domain-containing protein [Chthonomonadaceae bacterium]MCO5297537.1 DUF1501 domain-containing protein [Fimbriimonadaceae bacterium]